MKRKLDFLLDEKELGYLRKKVREFVLDLKKSLRKKKIAADVFVGGSFGKGTLTKSGVCDVDVFVRFDRKYKDLSKELEKILPRKGKRVHGSRDYFSFADGKLEIEVVPVLKIRKPEEAQNVTDLSYFHVSYVKRKLNERLRREISLAKKFCKAQRVYGAESYINGFSGYSLECLIIYFGRFEKMLRVLSKIKDREVIDPARHYKRKADALVELNESKTRGPLILVDPTFRERNILAGLNAESFEKFKKAAKSFLKNHSERFFLSDSFEVDRFKKKKGEFVRVVLETDRQEGDIAGTKMRKFSRFLIKEIERYFEVLGKEFDYYGGKKAELYLVLKPRGEVIRKGPSLADKRNVVRFRKQNKKVFVKSGDLYAREKVDFSGKEFVLKLAKGKKVREMSIIGLVATRN